MPVTPMRTRDVIDRHVTNEAYRWCSATNPATNSTGTVPS